MKNYFFPILMLVFIGAFMYLGFDLDQMVFVPVGISVSVFGLIITSVNIQTKDGKYFLPAYMFVPFAIIMFYEIISLYSFLHIF